MGKTIAICCQKGGVGKTSTCLALAAGLSLRGFKVLSIDLDPQLDFTYTTGAEESGASSMDLLTGGASPEEAIQHIDRWGDVIPASKALSGAEIHISETGKEYRLLEALDPIRERYDFILLDSPPSLGLLTVNALTAANSVLIPAQADVYSLKGISQLSETIGAVRKYCNPALAIEGILLTRYSSRSILSKDVSEMAEEMARGLGTRLFGSTIREAIAVKEAQIMQRSIFDHAPGSNVTKDYLSFIEELLSSSGDQPTGGKR